MKTVLVILIVIASVATSFFFAGKTYERRHNVQPPTVQLCDESKPRYIVWQEMPKLAWQSADGSPCKSGYVGACSLLEAGQATFMLADDGHWDLKDSCTCRVVRQ